MASAIQKTVRVGRWGSSLAVRIPQEAMEELGLKQGESLKMSISNGSITIRRANERKNWTEEDLLRGVTPDICGPDLIPDRVGKVLI